MDVIRRLTLPTNPTFFLYPPESAIDGLFYVDELLQRFLGRALSLDLLEVDSEDLLVSIRKNILKAQEALQFAQDSQQHQYNKRRLPAPKYKVGDVVFLDGTGINWPSFKGRPTESIPNYLGPFEILKIDSSRDNVTLNFPTFKDQSRFFPTFHVSKLKPLSSRQELFPHWQDPFDRPEAQFNDLFEVDRIVNMYE